LANAKFETIFQQEQHTDDLESFSDRIIYTIARKV